MDKLGKTDLKMKKYTKKIKTFILTLACVLGIGILGITPIVAHAEVSWPAISAAKPIKAYTRSTGRYITTYNSNMKVESGRYLWDTDELFISSVSNGKITYTYPSGNTRRTSCNYLNVLQTVANVEQRYLGLSNELNVGAANLREGLISYYYDQTHEIVIDIDSLMNDSSWQLLDSLTHEAFHSYEHRIVDAFNAADESIRKLRLFRNVDSYASEFDDYTSGQEDFYHYYNQSCESDAREYAESAVSEYKKRIDKYLLESAQERLSGNETENENADGE